MKRRNSTLRRILIIPALIVGHKSQTNNLVYTVVTGTATTRTTNLSFDEQSGSAYYTLATTPRRLSIWTRVSNSIVQADATITQIIPDTATQVDYAQVIENGHLAMIVRTTLGKIGFQVMKPLTPPVPPIPPSSFLNSSPIFDFGRDFTAIGKWDRRLIDWLRLANGNILVAFSAYDIVTAEYNLSDTPVTLIASSQK